MLYLTYDIEYEPKLRAFDFVFLKYFTSLSLIRPIKVVIK